MNFPFFYRWLNKSQTGSSPFSSYLLKRHALTQAKHGSLRVAQSPGSPDNWPDSEQALEWLYQLLSILDSKASALMRLNGVMLAAAAFMLHPEYHALGVIKVLVALSATGSTLSIACCLWVVSVDWPFLSQVEEKTTSGGDKIFDFSGEFYLLQQVADFRQKLYMTGWRASFVATGAFLLAIILFFLSQL